MINEHKNVWLSFALNEFFKLEMRSDMHDITGIYLKSSVGQKVKCSLQIMVWGLDIIEHVPLLSI